MRWVSGFSLEVMWSAMVGTCGFAGESKKRKRLLA